MKRLIALSVFQLLLYRLPAQVKNEVSDLSKGNYVIANLQENTIKERDRASQILRTLPNGSVIVRLKTNQKSIDAYRKSGRNNIADKIEADRKKQNEKMYQAFKHNFLFCKVYFIYANETEEFKKGDYKIFLNENVEHDSSIFFSDTNYVFCEYGSVMPFSDFHDRDLGYNIQTGASYSLSIPNNGHKIIDTISTQTSTSPATTSGLFFLDKNLQQLQRPFPFVEGVYMENYDAPVRSLNREMERAYQRLVLKKDLKAEMKKYKNQEKQKRKKSPKYNPFK